MDKLLHHYERELGRLREAARQYAAVHPNTAAALELEAGASTDPEVERLLQSVALLNAAMQQLIEQGRSEFHAALLQSLQPHYLRVVPACGIVHVDTSAGRPNEISCVSCLPRGTLMSAGAIRFTTAYDIDLAPIAITDARFQPTVDLPAILRLPSEATSALVITINTTANSASFDQPPLPKLRIHIDRSPELLDAILMRSLCVCLETEGGWQLLPATPFSPVGCGQDEPLIPAHFGQQSSRLQTELCHLPSKFGFVDLDLAAMSTCCAQGCKRISLHVVLPRCDARLRAASAANFRLFSTPVVNTFRQAATPIRMDGRSEAYPVIPREPGCEIYSINGVEVMSQGGNTVLPPFHGIEHTSPGPYWQLDEQEGVAIRLIDREQRAASLPAGTVAVQLTCTNSDPLHRPESLTLETSALGFPIRFLGSITTPKRFADPMSFCDGCYAEDTTLPTICKLLQLHGSKITENLKSLVARPSSAWIDHPMGRIHMQGVDFTLTVDEPAMQGHSIHVLAEVLSRTLADKTRQNRFAQLRIVNEEGQLLHVVPPRIGIRSVV